MKKQRLPWRCKDKKQAKDKATIYNSSEWHETRAAKLEANPLCELCEAEGYYRSATLVHHIHPIEDSRTMEEMKHWAFLWTNLQSLCRECHNKIHNQKGYHKKENVKARGKQALERWKSRLKANVKIKTN